MNLQCCRSVWECKMELRSLQDEYDLDSPYHGPKSDGQGHDRVLHGNPTLKAVIRRESLEKRISGKMSILQDIVEGAETELEGVDEPEFRSLLRWRLFSHLKWNEIARKYTTGISPVAVKKRFERFCDRYHIQLDESPRGSDCTEAS